MFFFIKLSLFFAPAVERTPELLINSSLFYVVLPVSYSRLTNKRPILSQTSVSYKEKKFYEIIHRCMSVF